MAHTERILSGVLRVAGGLMLLAAVAAFLPHEIMDIANRWLLAEELPRARVVDYLARSVSLLYAAQGAITLYLSYHVKQYAALLRVQARVAITLGMAMLLLDVRLGMPLYWVLLEGPWITLLGVVTLWLTHTLHQERSEG